MSPVAALANRRAGDGARDLLASPAEPNLAGCFATLEGLARRALGAQVADVALIAPDRDWVRRRLGPGPATQARPRPAVTAVADMALDPHFAALARQVGAGAMRSCLVAPLAASDGERIGALTVLDPAPRAFTDAEKALAADFAALAAELEESRQRASRDPVTGALLRADFAERAGRAAARCAATGATASILVLRLDALDALAAVRGRAAANAALVAAALACARSMRATDALARIGDDAFAVLLLDANRDAADRAGARLAKAMAEGGAAAGATLGVSRAARAWGPDLAGGHDWVGAAESGLA